jgi:hypothetical protein
MKIGLDAKWGISKFLQAREYRRAATHAQRFAQVGTPSKLHVTLLVSRLLSLSSPQTVSERAQLPSGRVRFSSESYFPYQGEQTGAPPSYLPVWDHTFESVTSVAKPLYRCYLSCQEAFPTPTQKREWAAIVWCEASVRTGTYPGPLFEHEWASTISV